jgi:hypothetical protein
MTAHKHMMLDVEDKRLTASERRILRSIVLRLSREPAQPEISDFKTDFEEELARVFGELKSRASDC